MPDKGPTPKMRPHFEDIQAHYDLSDDFFGLFRDPSRTYSCAYFEPAVRFVKFIITEIFPGGRIPTATMMQERGEAARFTVPEILSLRPHYIKTLGIWGDALEANRDKAIEIQSEEVYDRYMRYLRGCRGMFADVDLVAYYSSLRPRNRYSRFGVTVPTDRAATALRSANASAGTDCNSVDRFCRRSHRHAAGRRE